MRLKGHTLFWLLNIGSVPGPDRLRSVRACASGRQIVIEPDPSGNVALILRIGSSCLMQMQIIYTAK